MQQAEAGSDRPGGSLCVSVRLPWRALMSSTARMYMLSAMAASIGACGTCTTPSEARASVTLWPAVVPAEQSSARTS